MEGRKAMNMAAYLHRVGLVDVKLSVDVESLKLLQRSHLLTVPFENLDIHWKRPIVLDLDRFFSKVVEDRRGGFCYELNGLFNELLRSLGFQTRLISARVFNGADHGPEFDHAAIIVTIGDEKYLTDVGFGDFTTEPLRFIVNEEQRDPNGTFLIRGFKDEYFEVAKRDGAGWKSQYIFKGVARGLPEFAEMCDFQQYSPESHFTKGKLCSIMMPNGRKTLTDSKFIMTIDGDKVESQVSGEADFYRLLNDEFGIERIQ